MTISAAGQAYQGVGAQIRARREARGVSLRWLATKIEMAHPVLSKWERGKACIDADRLPLIAEILDCSPGDFFEESPSRLALVPPQPDPSFDDRVSDLVADYQANADRSRLARLRAIRSQLDELIADEETA